MHISPVTLECPFISLTQFPSNNVVCNTYFRFLLQILKWTLLVSFWTVAVFASSTCFALSWENLTGSLRAFSSASKADHVVQIILSSRSSNTPPLERNWTDFFNTLITPWESLVIACVLGRLIENSVTRRDTDRQFPKFDSKPNDELFEGRRNNDSWNS